VKEEYKQEQIHFGKNKRGLSSKIGEDRIIVLYTDGEHYGLSWRHIVDGEVVHKEGRAFTPDAMAAVVEMFGQLRGPLPEGATWDEEQ